MRDDQIDWLRLNKVPDNTQSQAGEYLCEAHLGELQPVRAKVSLKITSQLVSQNRSTLKNRPAESSSDSTDDDASDDGMRFHKMIAFDVSTNLAVGVLRNATRNLMPPKSERTPLIVGQ
ncbi:hypothetical protein DPMN_072509 [Dreissena polymorpha]|uniref:Uncharacterized protein n=1 Tax=Dreissena polymorpha TaxID=45954 RepID=A0A9D3Z4P4_DREPO|nr:hypothetical protein DPMN_072509 [Dreissena polymorpha]